MERCPSGLGCRSRKAVCGNAPGVRISPSPPAGGEGEIRTPGALPHTAFRERHPKPLGHLSISESTHPPPPLPSPDPPTPPRHAHLPVPPKVLAGPPCFSGSRRITFACPAGRGTA